MIDREQALVLIKSVFGRYNKIRNDDARKLQELKDGKLYELFVLSRVLEELRGRGFLIRLVGSSIKFKAAPGPINSNYSYFELYGPTSDEPDFAIYTDIEFQTLGSQQGMAQDDSGYHELDIAVVRFGARGRPLFNEIALGVECKATAVFNKSVVREVLGIRRELSFLAGMQPSALSQPTGVMQVTVPANPASELWLAYTDPKGDNYSASPSTFGVRFELWRP